MQVRSSGVIGLGTDGQCPTSAIPVWRAWHVVFGLDKLRLHADVRLRVATPFHFRDFVVFPITIGLLSLHELSRSTADASCGDSGGGC